jgi:hypothetical protein
MNPEFQRQLWLQFSTTRLVVLPALLWACFVAIGLSGIGKSLAALAFSAATLFGLLVWCMGTLAAGASVMDEIQERTWDQQRMSAMQPWAMTWGKLAGASAYGWYGGAFCLLVAVPTSVLAGLAPAMVLRLVLLGVLGGVLLQALLMALNLQLVKAGGQMARRGSMLLLVLLLVVLLLLLLVLLGAGQLLGRLGDTQHWWGHAFDGLDFALASLVLFVGCTLTAAWRSMAEVLAVRQLPWGWPALALLLTGYLTGFAPDQRLQVFGVTGLGTCAAFTYFALLAEPQPRPLWQRVLTRLDNRQWRAALLQLPRWPTTLALALPFALLVSGVLPPQATSARASGGLDSAIGSGSLYALVLVLLVARDCALALFLAFSPTGRRLLLSFGVLMGVLYGLLPWLLHSFHSKTLSGLALPLQTSGIPSVLFAALHLALALGLLRLRWRATAT